jgi:hypothetical protein
MAGGHAHHRMREEGAEEEAMEAIRSIGMNFNSMAGVVSFSVAVGVAMVILYDTVTLGGCPLAVNSCPVDDPLYDVLPQLWEEEVGLPRVWLFVIVMPLTAFLLDTARRFPQMQSVQRVVQVAVQRDVHRPAQLAVQRAVQHFLLMRHNYIHNY